jgi:DNA-binding MarR family transcriptional regulator
MINRAQPGSSRADNILEEDPDADVDAHLQPDGLDQIVGLHLKLAQAATHRSFLEQLAPLDVTQKQVTVLWLIDANPGVSQIKLAKTLNMDRATMMAIVDKLDGRELLERKRSKIDRRRQRLFLTPDGESLLVKAKALIAEHERQVKARIGEQLVPELVAALKRIYQTQ